MVLLSTMVSEVMWDFVIASSFKIAFKSSAFRWVELGFSPSEGKAHPWHMYVNHVSALWTPETEMKAACHKNRWIQGRFSVVAQFFVTEMRKIVGFNILVLNRGQCNTCYWFSWYSVLSHTVSLPLAERFVRILVWKVARGLPARPPSAEKVKGVWKTTVIYWTWNTLKFRLLFFIDHSKHKK